MNTGFETGTEGNGKTANMQTMALIVYTPGAWLFNGSAYYQFGKNKADKKYLLICLA